MRVAIIGSGIGGLGTAIMLAKAGYEVTVFEKNDVLGGRAGVFAEDGFTFDMGPSWYLMPDVFERFFASIGEDVHQHLDLIRLDPAYRVYFEGAKSPLDLHSSSEAAAEAFEQLEPGSGPAVRRYLAKAAKQYRLVVDHFLYKEYRSFLDLLSLRGIQALWTLPLIGSLDRYARQSFKSERARQLLEYTMVFLGASPYNAPAMYAMMAHVDFGLGVYYPQGGIGTLISALVAIGKKHGVTYRTDAPVHKIVAADGAVSAIELENGEQVPCDIVVSNADMHFTETVLLEEKDRSYPAAYWDDAVLAPSAILMYLGVRGELPELSHHTLYFCKDWNKNFDAIFEHPSWPKNPSFYLSNTSKTDPSVAPSGYENLFVLVPVAARFGTAEEAAAYADTMIDHIATTIGIRDLRERITYKKVFGPDDFSTRYHSQGGTALGLAHTLGQTALFRPQNKSKKLSNLYYAGAGVHPGIGLPVCLISSELVAKRILQEHRS